MDVSVTIKEKRSHKTTTTTRVPLELKTGKMFRKQGTIEHRAQVRVHTEYARGFFFVCFLRMYLCPRHGFIVGFSAIHFLV